MEHLYHSRLASETDGKVMNLEVPRMTKERLDEICKRYNLFKNTYMVQVLYLHKEGFQKIECLEEYIQLKYLWLHFNAITQISGLANQTKLTHLYLQSNQISRIENLNSLKNLHTLNLSSNRIEKIENIGTDILPVLKKLDLSYNNFRSADSIRELEKCLELTDLNLSKNNIAHLLVLKVLGNIPKLSTLNLSNNYIVSILYQYRRVMILECKNLLFLDKYRIYSTERENAQKWLAIDTQIAKARCDLYLKHKYQQNKNFANKSKNCPNVEEIFSDESDEISDSDINGQSQTVQCENLNELSIVPEFAEDDECSLNSSDDEGTSDTSGTKCVEKEWIVKTPNWEKVYHNIKTRENNDSKEIEMAHATKQMLPATPSDIIEAEDKGSKVEALENSEVVTATDQEDVNNADNSIPNIFTLIDYHVEESKLLNELRILETDKDCLNKINEVQRNIWKDIDKRKQLHHEITNCYTKIFCENIMNNGDSKILKNDTTLKQNSTAVNSITQIDCKTSGSQYNLHALAENIAEEMYIKYRNSNLVIDDVALNGTAENVSSIDAVNVFVNEESEKVCAQSLVQREIYPELKPTEEFELEDVLSNTESMNLNKTVYTVIHKFNNFMEELERKKSEETARKAEVERLMQKYSKYLEPQNKNTEDISYRDYGPKCGAKDGGTIEIAKYNSLSKDNDSNTSKAVVKVAEIMVEYIEPSINTVESTNEKKEHHCSEVFEYHSTMHDDFSIQRSANRFINDDDNEIILDNNSIDDDLPLPNDIVQADTEFFDKLDFEKIKLDDLDNETAPVECVQSYEELRKFVDCNELNSALTDDEIVLLNEILELSLATKNSKEIDVDKYPDENILLRKLVERALFHKENHQHHFNKEQLELMYKYAHLYAMTKLKCVTSQYQIPSSMNSKQSETNESAIKMLNKKITQKSQFKRKNTCYNARNTTKKQLMGIIRTKYVKGKNKLKIDRKLKAKPKSTNNSEEMVCTEKDEQITSKSTHNGMQVPSAGIEQAKSTQQNTETVNSNPQSLMKLLEEFSKGLRNKENTAEMILMCRNECSSINPQDDETKEDTVKCKQSIVMKEQALCDVAIKTEGRKCKFSVEFPSSRLSANWNDLIHESDNKLKDKSIQEPTCAEEEAGLLLAKEVQSEEMLPKSAGSVQISVKQPDKI